MIILSTSRMTLCGWRDRKELFNCEVAYIYYIKPTTSPPQLRQEGEPLPPLTTETSMASVGAAIQHSSPCSNLNTERGAPVRLLRLLLMVEWSTHHHCWGCETTAGVVRPLDLPSNSTPYANLYSDLMRIH